MIDWGVGEYEETAFELAPVAERLVEKLSPVSGARLLDVGCGTGCAALAAARLGARATGVDPARRLVDLAEEEARREGLEVELVVGDARELPFDDASFDLAVSNFGIVFAPDADAAVRELLRVLRPGGRAAVSAWQAGNPLDAAMSVIARAVAEILPSRPGPSFSWSDEAAVRDLFERREARLSVERGSLQFTGESTEEYVSRLGRHPMSIAARGLLEHAGRWEEVRAEFTERLEERNEDPGAFAITSRYYVLVAELAG